MKAQLSDSNHLNLPDLAFFQWCHSQFGVNKGVYNTIDTWLYESGVEEILERRNYTEEFLRYIKDVQLDSDQHRFLRLDNGRLIRRLYEFVERNKNKRNYV